MNAEPVETKAPPPKSLMSVFLRENGSYTVWGESPLLLTELSATLNQLYATLICKGVYRFTLTRRPDFGTTIHLTVNPQVPVKPIEYSHYVPVRFLLRDGIVPRFFKPEEVWNQDDNSVMVVPGHQRMGGMRQVLLGTPASGKIVLNGPVNDELSVAELAFYLAEATVPFLWHGARTHNIQISGAMYQHLFDVRLKTEVLHSMLHANTPCYPFSSTVANLIAK